MKLLRIEEIENQEEYAMRLREIEKFCKNIIGVSDAYALQAGREIRVLIDPDKLNDQQASEIALKVKHELRNIVNIPGKVIVTVIRELRISETF
jgi:ribonuclease Y